MTSVSDDKTRPHRLGKRYEIIDEIGSGGYGTVYRARDEITKRVVAIKVLDASASAAGVNAWREAASLRRLNLPGVVQLLDEGIWGDRPYLVMPVIDGEHFPGASGDNEGEFPAETILALVELLTLVHAEGIVHGDLKPQNVLVGDDGRVTLLDFGTGSWTAGHPVDHRLKRTRGTPAFMAPEQLRGQRATVQSDYYALGVMLFHVITGEFPHPIESIEALTRARLSWRAPRLDAERLGISARLARAVEGLLAPAGSRRLAHLRELVEALDASQTHRLDDRHINEHTLTFLDPKGLLDQAVSTIGRGGSVDIVGRKGSGKTRFLHELVDRLRGQGRRVIRLVASSRPYGSLMPLIGTSKLDSLERDGGIDTMHRLCRGAIEQALEENKALVADTFEKIDPRTRDLLQMLRHRGGLVRALRLDSEPNSAQPQEMERHQVQDENTIVLTPFSAKDLQALFDGPEPIFRSRSEAAHQLWLRTGGHPRAMAREIELWVRHALAHHREDKVVVPAQQLERLRRGLQLHTPTPAMAIFADDIEMQTLLVWIKLAGSHATVAHLAPLIGVDEARLGEDVERLIDRGAVTCAPDGVLVLLVDALAHCPLGSDELEEIHHTLAGALEPGTPGRLLHLLRAGSLGEIIEEARASAQYHDQRGEVGLAIAALTEAVWACHQFGALDESDALLTDWAKIALATTETARLEELLYAIEQISPQEDSQLAHLESLVNLARIASQRADLETLERLEQLAPFEDWELELRRHMYRVQVVLRHSPAETGQVLESIERWAEDTGEPEVEGSLIGWRGSLAHLNHDFEGAARHHIQAARIKKRPTARLASWISAATSLMDALEYAEALTRAQRALELADELHHHHYHGYCLGLMRSVRYRSGEPLEPAPELGEALRLLGIPTVLGRFLLTEAALAWRAGRRDDAVRLSQQASAVFDEAHIPSGSLLSKSLWLHCTDDAEVNVVDQLADEAIEHPSDRLEIQVLGLLARHLHPQDADLRTEVRRLARSLPFEGRDVRQEILSINEAMAELE